MIQYFDDYDLACIDGYSFRKDKKTGYYLSSKLIDGKRKRLHVYVWEKVNGKVPKGYEVHHRDENKQNNALNNLMLLTRSEHQSYHMRTQSDELKQKRSKHLLETAIPAAKEWHKSKEGREWHRQHGIDSISKREPVKYYCSYCGKEFESRHRYGADQNTFCSNKCKAAYRRKSGVDDVEFICKKCGCTFKGNKYAKIIYCIDCRKK